MQMLWRPCGDTAPHYLLIASGGGLCRSACCLDGQAALHDTSVFSRGCMWMSDWCSDLELKRLTELLPLHVKGISKAPLSYFFLILTKQNYNNVMIFGTWWLPQETISAARWVWLYCKARSTWKWVMFILIIYDTISFCHMLFMNAAFISLFGFTFYMLFLLYFLSRIDSGTCIGRRNINYDHF